ncbi:MAG TPA: nucleotide exchange factor GrpE [Polyangiales bacterium]|jgi:molecular chaperone GrpE|nr:nucleotide exchange factor GrpE [Polyangiales bacterium]
MADENSSAPAEPSAGEPKTNSDASPTPNGETAAASAAPGGASATTDPLAALTAERDQFREQLLRTAADFENFRKRTRRELEDAKMRGKDDAVKEILPVFDNLERAVAAADTAQSVGSVVEGVKMVLKLFQDTAERMGLKRVPTVGQRFDPQMHEAIQQKETDEAPAGSIIAEIMPGYMFGQRLLRAAMVVVARKPSAPKPPDAAASGSAPAAAGPSNAPQAKNSVPPPGAGASVKPPAADGGGSGGGTPEGGGSSA